MAIARDVLSQARVILQDETSVRWPLSELVGWLNNGLREIRVSKPELFNVNVVLTLAAGARQALASTDERLVRVVSNARDSNTPRARRQEITVVDRGLIDSTLPGWMDDLRPKQQVRHVMFDEAEPNAFYVWPINDGTGKINAVVTRPHAPVTVQPSNADPTDITKYTSTLPIDDVYTNALIDFVLYRAYGKDAQFSNNAERSAAYYGQFARAIGIETAQDAASSPNAKPGVARASTGVSAGGASA